jgi:hypothetical protein
MFRPTVRLLRFFAELLSMETHTVDAETRVTSLLWERAYPAVA